MADFAIERTRLIDAPIGDVWAVVSDAGGYHQVVDTLEHTEITSGRGEGMTRHCLDTRGREWNEVCTLWEDGRRFRMTVDVESYPAAFRAIFAEVAGTWPVEPEEHGVKVTMRFDGVTRLGPIGRMAVAALGRDAVLSGIFDGYEELIQSRQSGSLGGA